jgi:hypothetical protein
MVDSLHRNSLKQDAARLKPARTAGTAEIAAQEHAGDR